MGDDASLPLPSVVYKNVDDYEKYFGDEPEGGKRKEWLRAPDGGCWLFKEGESNAKDWGKNHPYDHTENWSEIVAERVCACLGLPCAEYRLATYEGAFGTVSKNMLPPGAQLIDAFDHMKWHWSGVVDAEKARRNHEYTVDSSFALTPLGWALPPPGADAGKSAVFYFAGYLILDALIANRDRHYHNWAFWRNAEEEDSVVFAPTFDHGASFCKERPEDQGKRLTTRDRGYAIDAWCGKTRTKFRRTRGGKRLTTTEAVSEACRVIKTRRFAEGVAEQWAEVVGALDVARDIAPLIRAFPCDIIPDACKEFAVRMLKINRERVLTALREARG